MGKLKEYKKTIIITSIITLIPMLIGILLWDKLPNEIATHFDGSGTPNDWSSKYVAVFGIPLLLLIIHFIAIAATLADPNKKNISSKVFKLILWIIPLVSLFSITSIYRYELDNSINAAAGVTTMLGVVFIIIGNYLPKCHHNYTVGIKIPWTLHDEENWNQTHRLAGKLWTTGGLLITIFSFIVPDSSLVFPIIACIMVLVPVLYSFLYYVKHK